MVPFADGSSTTFNFAYLLRGSTFFVDIKPVSWTTSNQLVAPERQFEAIRVIFVPTEKFRRVSAEVNMKDYNTAMSALGLTESDVQVIK